jgi:sugar phosphate isomerase/epimerase
VEKLSRRHMIALGGGLAATFGCGRTRAAVAPASDMTIGVQLYCVGDDLRRDFEGTLKRLADVGYRDVQLSDTFGKSAKDLRAAFDKAGLRCRSAHYDLANLQYLLDDNLAAAKDLGLTSMVCAHPRLPRSACAGVGDWQWNADFLNIIGAQTKRAGLAFLYHNHNVEFMRLGEGTAFDALVAGTDPALVGFELDCGWAASAGIDPAALIARYPTRIRSLHIKDIKDTKAGTKANTAGRIVSAAIGSGTLDWKKILSAAKDAGIKSAYVELEPPHAPDAMTLLQQSRSYLDSL